jgi:flagellar basal body-associated protein FliL
MILEKRQLREPNTMSSILIAISLIILLVLGLAALFLAGDSHESSSAEDPSDED